MLKFMHTAHSYNFKVVQGQLMKKCSVTATIRKCRLGTAHDIAFQQLNVIYWTLDMMWHVSHNFLSIEASYNHVPCGLTQARPLKVSPFWGRWGLIMTPLQTAAQIIEVKLLFFFINYYHLYQLPWINMITSIQIIIITSINGQCWWMIC